jgi:RNA polymerase sigma-70 factor (ECF subfamily)
VEINDELRGSDAHESRATEILELIRSLPEAYRETLILRLVEGMTGPEIATRTGLTAASVRVNLHRGMKLLRERLGFGEGV